MGSGQSKGLKGGYRILKICEDSPASECDLEIFFDYIIQIEGIKIVDGSKKVYESFIKKVKESVNKSVVLLVYNCRFDKTKEVKIIPQKWKGNGLLGININYEPFNALNEGTRIIDILKNSPAENSDLVEQKDFFIGCEDSILRSREDVLSYVNAKYIEHMKNPNNDILYMNFFVYNIDTNTIRKVKLQPSKSWGGDGLLGCNIANGILHKIPVFSSEDNLMDNETVAITATNTVNVTNMTNATNVTNDTNANNVTTVVDTNNAIDVMKPKENGTAKELGEFMTKDKTMQVENTLQDTEEKTTMMTNVKGMTSMTSVMASTKETFEYVDSENNSQLNDLNEGIERRVDNTVLGNLKEIECNKTSNENENENENNNNRNNNINNNSNNNSNNNINNNNNNIRNDVYEVKVAEIIKIEKDDKLIKVKSDNSIMLNNKNNVENENSEIQEKSQIEKKDVKENVEGEEKDKEKETETETDIIKENIKGDEIIENKENENSYIDFVEQMNTYTKEVDDICARMNKNNEILNNLGLNTNMKNFSYQNQSNEINFQSNEINFEDKLSDNNSVEKMEKKAENNSCNKAQEEERQETNDGKENDNNKENDKDEDKDNGEYCVENKSCNEVEDIHKGSGTINENIDEKYKKDDESVENVQLKENVEKKEAMQNVNRNVFEENREEIHVNENININENVQSRENEISKLEMTNVTTNDNDDNKDDNNDNNNDDNNNDDTSNRKHIFTTNNDINLIATDLPKAGIIYPTTDL